MSIWEKALVVLGGTLIGLVGLWLSVGLLRDAVTGQLGDNTAVALIPGLSIAIFSCLVAAYSFNRTSASKGGEGRKQVGLRLPDARIVMVAASLVVLLLMAYYIFSTK